MLDRFLDRIGTACSLLVLPLALLLFLQWPLRDMLGAGSRPANDMAQWLFALYVAFALRQASRWHSHLAADALAAHYPPRVRQLLDRFGHPIAVLPFALYVLASGAPVAWNALRTLELFPDTFNPGYFIVKVSAWLLALLMALQAVADLLAPPTRSQDTSS